MVSWDLKARFLGLSPNVEELKRLAKQEGFSNIESMEFIESDDNSSSTYRLCVNNRGTKQTKFKYEVVSN